MKTSTCLYSNALKQKLIYFQFIEKAHFECGEYSQSLSLELTHKILSTKGDITKSRKAEKAEF
jgi:hypothetical protein